MAGFTFRTVVAAVLAATPLIAQTTRQPLPPIDPAKGVIAVNVAEFASVPDVGGVAARMMLLVDEPGTRRMFVNDMRGPLYTVSYDGKTVTRYVDINDSTWGVDVNSQGRERGFQSFAFHPQFGQTGTPGYGKFYTWTDSRKNQEAADFKPAGGTNTHHTVLFEWTARTAAAATYDGGPPREMMRFEQPFANHNGGLAVFNPLARPGSADFGLLYVGVADGGSGGDPFNAAQNLSSGFGKLFRIDPLGRNSVNGKYGVPASNPFVGSGAPAPNALPEIYAYGMRNPQRFGWDSKNGNMYLADIGQNVVEKVSLVTAGANLGWNVWEGSYGFTRAGVDTTRLRGDPKVVFPAVEYAHGDPLLLGQVAVTGVHVFRASAIPALNNKVVFGDNPSGEIFYFDADNAPRGGSADMHRVLLRTPAAEPRTLLQLIRERNAQQGKSATRADLRFGVGNEGRVFLLNKADGTIRVLVP
jgi:hypothetical protein